MLIKNGRVIDAGSKTDVIADILVEGDIIKKIDKNINKENETIIDAGGKIIAPGLIDIQAQQPEAVLLQLSVWLTLIQRSII